MDPTLAGVILVAALFVFLASGVWIALALAAVGWIAMALFTGAPVGKVMATTTWGSMTSWSLTALPLFIWMGEILFRSRVSQDMFHGLAPWMARVPGRLLHCNVLGCGIFAAISGSSAATAATIGKMTVPELAKRGYDETMSIGSLAGAGTLGLLIPPSIIMIVYGVAAQVSIARLFIAGVLPGLLLMALFSGYIIIWALLHPGRVPPSEAPPSLREKLWASRRLIPVVLLIAAVIGSIYSGVATPTESAVLGVVGSLIMSWASDGFSLKLFRDGLLGATRTSCMIAFILAGAAFLTTAMGYTGIPRLMAEWIAAQQLSQLALIAALTVLYVVLGCFIDGISMVVLTAAVILPSVQAAGIDLLWFGIFVVLVVEMAQITPPVGFNLFVLQGLTGRGIFFIGRAAIPFFLLMVAAVGLIYAFPEIVSALPDAMMGRK